MALPQVFVTSGNIRITLPGGIVKPESFLPYVEDNSDGTVYYGISDVQNDGFQVNRLTTVIRAVNVIDLQAAAVLVNGVTAATSDQVAALQAQVTQNYNEMVGRHDNQDTQISALTGSYNSFVAAQTAENASIRADASAADAALDAQITQNYNEMVGRHDAQQTQFESLAQTVSDYRQLQIQGDMDTLSAAKTYTDEREVEIRADVSAADAALHAQLDPLNSLADHFIDAAASSGDITMEAKRPDGRPFGASIKLSDPDSTAFTDAIVLKSFTGDIRTEGGRVISTGDYSLSLGSRFGNGVYRSSLDLTTNPDADGYTTKLQAKFGDALVGGTKVDIKTDASDWARVTARTGYVETQSWGLRQYHNNVELHTGTGVDKDSAADKRASMRMDTGRVNFTAEDYLFTATGEQEGFRVHALDPANPNPSFPMNIFDFRAYGLYLSRRGSPMPGSANNTLGQATISVTEAASSPLIDLQTSSVINELHPNSVHISGYGVNVGGTGNLTLMQRGADGLPQSRLEFTEGDSKWTASGFAKVVAPLGMLLNGQPLADQNFAYSKSVIDSKDAATLASAQAYTYSQATIDNKLSDVVLGVDRKEPVATFADLATSYPSPEIGWKSFVIDQALDYTWNGTNWIKPVDTSPMADSNTNGLMSSAHYDKIVQIDSQILTSRNEAYALSQLYTDQEVSASAASLGAAINQVDSDLNSFAASVASTYYPKATVDSKDSDTLIAANNYTDSAAASLSNAINQVDSDLNSFAAYAANTYYPKATVDSLLDDHAKLAVTNTFIATNTFTKKVTISETGAGETLEVNHNGSGVALKINHSGSGNYLEFGTNVMTLDSSGRTAFGGAVVGNNSLVQITNPLITNFDPSVGDNNALFISSLTSVPALNAYGQGFTFGKLGSNRPLAAIVPKQTSADADQGGVSILVHSGVTSSDVLEEAVVVTHDKKMFLDGKEVLTNSVGWFAVNNATSTEGWVEVCKVENSDATSDRGILELSFAQYQDDDQEILTIPFGSSNSGASPEPSPLWMYGYKKSPTSANSAINDLYVKDNQDGTIGIWVTIKEFTRVYATYSGNVGLIDRETRTGGDVNTTIPTGLVSKPIENVSLGGAKAYASLSRTTTNQIAQAQTTSNTWQQVTADTGNPALTFFADSYESGGAFIIDAAAGTMTATRDISCLINFGASVETNAPLTTHEFSVFKNSNPTPEASIQTVFSNGFQSVQISNVPAPCFSILAGDVLSLRFRTIGVSATVKFYRPIITITEL